MNLKLCIYNIGEVMIEIVQQLHGPDYIENHLGGCSSGGDGGTYYPIMWEFMVNKYKIKSVLDVGCGRGFSSKFFKSLDCKVLGVEGCEDAIKNSLIPDNILKNDYEISSAVKNKKFDLCWSCEFVEHVYEKYMSNFLNDFKTCKYVAMTFAEIGQGGHHHVNENTETYWIKTLSDFGFQFLEEDTKILRTKALEDKQNREKNVNNPFFICHFLYRGLFFYNLNYDNI